MLCRQAEMLPDRVHRPGLPHRIGVEGVPAAAARCTATALPGGLLESAQLPEPVFTPSTKADDRRPRREHLLRARRSTWSAASWPSGPATSSLELYPRGAEWARRARDHHRRHQVRARARRRRAGRGRRGAHARLVAVLAGRPVGAGHHAAVVRQAAGPRLPRRRSTGTSSRRPRRCPPRSSRPPAPATSRPTSASPAGPSPTGPASTGDRADVTVSGRTCRCASMAP